MEEHGVFVVIQYNIRLLIVLSRIVFYLYPGFAGSRRYTFTHYDIFIFTISTFSLGLTVN